MIHPQPVHTERLTYEPALDGLRGIAVMLVVLGHAGVTGFANGFVGVTIFFVLSGYLITRVLLDDHRRPVEVLRSFYIRRAGRLWPALLLVLAAVATVSLLTGTFDRVALGLVSSALYVSNIVVSAGNELGPLQPTWTLAMEEQFYLVWPLVLLFLGPGRRTIALLVALTVGSVVLRASVGAEIPAIWWANHSPLTRLDGLGLGCIAALVGIRRPSKLLVAVAAVGLAVIVSSPIEPDVMVRFVLFPAAALALIVILGRPGVLAIDPLVQLGKISYGLYLWHLPVSFLLPDPRVWIPVAIALAAVSYLVVERPIREAARRLADHRSPARMVPQPV